MQDALAVILGGGAGTRLYPLTRERAKPAVPLGGKYRLIDIPISNCLNSGLNYIFALTQYLSASLNRHISWTYNNIGPFSRGWVQILAAEQTPGSKMAEMWYQGTADAVRKQVTEIEAVGAENIIILGGDHLYRMDYRKFIGFHLQSGADVTVGAQPVTAEQAPSLGILATDHSGHIKNWVEKPRPDALPSLASGDDPDRPYLASMGIYVFKWKVLKQLLGQSIEPDFGHHIIPAAIERHSVYAYTFDGFWADIGTIRSFFEVNLMLAQPDSPFRFYDEHMPIYTHPRFLPPVLATRCDLENVLLSEGCELCGATISNAVIGVRSKIGCNTTIRNTMMLGADYDDNKQLTEPSGKQYSIPLGIGEDCRIEGAILDKNVRIGNGVTIHQHSPGEDLKVPADCPRGQELYVIRDGIVVIPKNTEIPDGTVI
jgi:glucose-1-phosphate adenylyltransferase